ncbi:response regulator [Edaphobacter sp. 12200R-103]|jgi:CheY-like chemotaxis protein|uniref:response regulator n=1 Tax=Edaphobacter sp. 12200R-103 TaxID=2703788 RepID=UPI00138C50FF|nr:response regulator [Edaphobacter sp. 12200R-103]QHS50906.1 response regulator [Edaphobacter sp. 12200R-103]
MQSKTILLVDDNAVQAMIRRTILERNGYATITVLQPARALDHLRNSDSPSSIDLVITDHIMPGMSGSTFSREVRGLRPTIPILVISGMEDAYLEYEGLNVEFRAKPLQPEILLQSVQQLIGIPEPSVSSSVLAAVIA